MAKKKQQTDVYWRCFPPYIDAYRCTDFMKDDDAYRANTSMTQAIEDLKSAMTGNAHQWGVQSIGEQVLREGRHCELFEGKVLQVGYVQYKGVTGKETRKNFALVWRDRKFDKGSMYENWEVLEVPSYPHEWDVT